MRRAISLCLIASASMAAAPWPFQRLEPSPPQWTEQVTSYGEEGRDLSALFVPFFAMRDFAQHPSQASNLKIEEADAVYFGPHSDYIAVIGRYNCIILRYYGTVRLFPKYDDDGIKGRADAFRDDMLRFVAGLPEPRPTTKDLDLRSRYCAKPSVATDQAEHAQ
jgi:hypothetical protein